MGEGLSSMAKSVDRLANVLACSDVSGHVVSSNSNPHIMEADELQNDVNQLNTSTADLKTIMKTLLNRSKTVLLSSLSAVVYKLAYPLLNTCTTISVHGWNFIGVDQPCS